MLILKINQLEAGVRVLSQTRDMEGALAWMPALGGKLVPDAEADAYIERAVKRDPDAWVVEIEARDGRHPFEGKELKIEGKELSATIRVSRTIGRGSGWERRHQ